MSAALTTVLTTLLSWLGGSGLARGLARGLALAALALPALWLGWRRARAGGALAARIAARQQALADRIDELKEKRHAEIAARRLDTAELRRRVRRYARGGDAEA